MFHIHHVFGLAQKYFVVSLLCKVFPEGRVPEARDFFSIRLCGQANCMRWRNMLAVFHAGEALFHTGWFIESMATQVLVIFIIRNRRNPFKSRPNPRLVACSLSVAATVFFYPICGGVKLKEKFFSHDAQTAK